MNTNRAWRRLAMSSGVGLIATYLLVVGGFVDAIEASINERAIRGDLPGNLSFLETLSDATNNEPLLVAGLIVIVGFLVAGAWRSAVAFLVVNAVSAVAVTILKDVVGRERPGGAATLWETASWPSGHTTGTMTFALALLVLVGTSRRTQAILGVVVVPVALAVGYSRIFLGVHWPTDVLAGWLLSTFLVSLMMLVSGGSLGRVHRPSAVLGSTVLAISSMAFTGFS